MKIHKDIIKCRICPRLVQFREKIAKEKRKQYKDETYWGKPVTGFGDMKANIVIVGLAPAAIEQEGFLLGIDQLNFFTDVYIKKVLAICQTLLISKMD